MKKCARRSENLNSDPESGWGRTFLFMKTLSSRSFGSSMFLLRDEIVEIGPGLGFLTRRLLDTAKRVWAVEIDPALVNRLKQSSLGSHPALHLIHNDILKVAPEEFLPPHKVKLVGNLPYSISTPVLFRLFDWREHFSSLVLMMQKKSPTEWPAVRPQKRTGHYQYGAKSMDKLLKAYRSPRRHSSPNQSQIDDSKDRPLPRAADACKRASFITRAYPRRFRSAAQDPR